MINDIIKTKNKFINKKFNKSYEKPLISNIKSIQELFFTNNICESFHSKMANFLPNGPTTKSNFWDILDYVLREYSYKTNQIIRKDYISRTCIIIMEKLEINKTKKPIEYDDFKNELKKTIAYMTGKCNINLVEEIINSIKSEAEEENIIKDNDENSDDGIICKDEVEDNI